MKLIIVFKYYFLMILFCLIYSGSCNKPIEDCRLPEHKGTMNALINGDTWSAYPRGHQTSITAIVGSYYYEPGCRLQQIIELHIPYRKEGIYEFDIDADTVNNKAYLLFTFIDVDEILAYYRIPEGKENGFVEVTSYNESTKRITGKFNGIVYLDRNFGLIDPQDSLVITDGEFDTSFPN